MAYVTLRVLTLKSKIGFGKYSDLTVKQAIALSHISYLAWAYYTRSAISFNAEVLAMIGVTELVSKPGVDLAYWEANKSRFDKLNRETYSSATEGAMNRSFENKIAVDGITHRSLFYNNKGRLARYNSTGMQPLYRMPCSKGK